MSQLYEDEIADKFLSLVDQGASRIRNISIIAHVDHGKTTITDHLLSHNGIIGKAAAGKLQFMDSRQDEMERFITINASSVSLHFTPSPPIQFSELSGDASLDMKRRDSSAHPHVSKMDQNKEHMINLIDCPGHQDFLSEVDASVAVSDGCIVVIDSVEGVKAQTKAVLRRSWTSGCTVILFINKIDRLFEELYLNPKEAYEQVSNIFADVGGVMGEILQADALTQTDTTEITDEVEAAEVPEITRGKVLIGSAKQGWCMSITPMATLFMNRFKLDQKDDNEIPRICEHLWGPWSWNPKSKDFVHIPSQSKVGMYLGASFVMTLISKIYENWNDVKGLLAPADILFTSLFPELPEGYSQNFLNEVDQMYQNNSFPYPVGEALMRKCFPLASNLLELSCWRLPPPDQMLTQDCRWKRIHPSSNWNEVATCDTLCYSPRSIAVNITTKKVVLDSLGEDEPDVSHFLAVCQVIKGKLAIGDRLYVQKIGAEGLVEIMVDQLHLLMGTDLIPLNRAGAGMVVGVGFKSVNNNCLRTGKTVYGVNTEVFDDDMTQWIKHLAPNSSKSNESLVWTDLRNLTFSSMKDINPLGRIMHSHGTAVMRVKLTTSLEHRSMLRAGLWRSIRTDSSVHVSVNDAGDLILAVNGAIQLEKVLKDLELVYARCPFSAGEAAVQLCETIVSVQTAEQDWMKIEMLKGVTKVNSSKYRENLMQLNESSPGLLPFPPWASHNRYPSDVEYTRFDARPYLKKSIKGRNMSSNHSSAATWVVSASPFSDEKTSTEEGGNSDRSDKESEDELILSELYNESTGMRTMFVLASDASNILSAGNSSSAASEEMIIAHKRLYKFLSSQSKNAETKDNDEAILPEGCDRLGVLTAMDEGFKNAFSRVSRRGPVMGKPLRCVKFRLDLLWLHYNPNENTRVLVDEITKPFIDSLNYSLLQRGRIRVVEPLVSTSVTCDQARLGFVHKVLDQRRAKKSTEEYLEGSSRILLSCQMALSEMQGLLVEMRNEAKGLVHIELEEDDIIWRTMQEDPFPEGAMTEEELEDVGESIGSVWAGNRARELIMNARESVGTGKKIVDFAEKQRTMTKMK